MVGTFFRPESPVHEHIWRSREGDREHDHEHARKNPAGRLAAGQRRGVVGALLPLFDIEIVANARVALGTTHRLTATRREERNVTGVYQPSKECAISWANCKGAYAAVHSCAVLANGTGRCWGFNEVGALGNGTTTHSSIPVVVSGLTNAVAIAGTDSQECALRTNGTAQCWGRNNEGQLGNGTTTSSSTPVVVSGLSNAAAIAAGGLHSCALLAKRDRPLLGLQLLRPTG